MAEYYLISQLPTLDAVGSSSPLPISEEYFMELCRRFLGKKALSELNKISLTPPRSAQKSSSSLINAWNNGERELRFALGLARAERMTKAFDCEVVISPARMQAARSVVEIKSPLEAEKFLNDYRLAFLESIRPSDSFSEDFVFFYLLKLRLLKRIKDFDAASGEIAYRNIYASIVDGDRSEATQ